MRQFQILWLSLGILVSGAALVAAQENCPSTPGLVPRLRWAQFEVVFGRIRVIRPRYTKTKSQNSEDSKTGITESVVVSVDSGRPSLYYERCDKLARVEIEFNGPSALTMRRQPRSAELGVAVEYTQPERGPLKLVIRDGSTTRTYAAASVWQLLLEQPTVCKEHLLPLLCRIRTDWRLPEQVAQVEHALFRLSETGITSDREHWAECVNELGSADFRVRQAADRELRQAGLGIIGYLDSLNHKRLDSEQRMRIDRIRRSMLPDRGDAASAVAHWLVDEKLVWIAILGHRDADKRARAAQHLQGLCDSPLDFDPFADSDLRRQQIDRLASTLSN